MRSISSRISVMTGEGALSVYARAKELEAEGRSIIHLELGEPDFHPGQSVMESLQRALAEGKDRYCPMAGLPALKQEIAAYLERTRHIQVAAENVVVAPGCKIALFQSMMALLEPGDEVLYPDPGFPGYASIARGLGAVPVPFTLAAGNQLQPDPAEVAAKITPRTRMLLTNSPGNPTGTVYTDAVQRALAELAVKHDLWVLSDEIYARIIYGTEYLSMLRYPGMAERTLIIDGFSKSFAMTGWRLGYTVAPPEVVPALVMMVVNTYTCVAEFTQYAAIDALRDRENNTTRMVGEFTRRREQFSRDLNRVPGFRCLPPSRRCLLCLGGYYGHGHQRRRVVPHPARGRRSGCNSRCSLRRCGEGLHPVLVCFLDGDIAGGGRAHSKGVERVGEDSGSPLTVVAELSTREKHQAPRAGSCQEAVGGPMRIRMISVLWVVVALPLVAAAQARPFPGPDVQQIYQRLLPQIEKIPAFDHHAHPGFADDPDVDAMAAPPNASEALRTRDDNPELAAAAKALFGYPYNDLSPEHAKWLLNKKTELKKQLSGTAYFDSILDKINIESSVANRAMMADYLDPKRFVWVFFADAFMWPFNNERETARNPDEGVYIPLQEKMLHRWMQQENVSKLPASFEDYLKFVSRTLEDNSKRGGIAMKFEVAYFRPTTFSDPSQAQAQDIYTRFVGGGIPTEKEYRTFQDFIFRYLVQEGGRLHLPVHIHTAIGIGDYFNFSQSNIMNLESVLRDPRYSSTTFVMIHAGYPLEREAIWLAAMKNVYLDTSFGELAQYPSAFKDTLKMFLETFPDKITFGTDCFPYNEVLGAEESYWLGAQSSRMALAAALAEMVSEGEINESRAMELAHAYLHDTAVKLYNGRVH